MSAAAGRLKRTKGRPWPEFGALTVRGCPKPAKTRLDPVNVSPVTEPWVSADAIAEHLGVTKDSVYSWIATKGMPAHRVGRLWKFQVSEVDAWVRADSADTAGAE